MTLFSATVPEDFTFRKVFTMHLCYGEKKSDFLESLCVGIWIIKASFQWAGEGREEIAWGYC